MKALGRGAPDPLAMTARNFALGAPLAALAWLASATTGIAHAHIAVASALPVLHVVCTTPLCTSWTA